MAIRKFWPEISGMCLYYSDEKKYFYAWNYINARKKAPGGALYVVNDFGEKKICGKE